MEIAMILVLKEVLVKVNQDFARTMNKIIMEKTLEKSPEELADMIPANL